MSYFSSYLRVANVFSARVAFGQHATQLGDAIVEANIPQVKHLLGRAAVLAGEALVFRVVIHFLEKMVSLLFLFGASLAHARHIAPRFDESS